MTGCKAACINHSPSSLLWYLNLTHITRAIDLSVELGFVKCSELFIRIAGVFGMMIGLGIRSLIGVGHN